MLPQSKTQCGALSNLFDERGEMLDVVKRAMAAPSKKHRKRQEKAINTEGSERHFLRLRGR